MNVRLLIDSIMRQTTVLIAQLSTAAGVRAPLAHIADHVFLSLSREIEAQGVGRKVAADMFGLALRGYQKKTQRLAASRSTQGKTLFEAVLEFIEREGGTTRSAVLDRFRHDGERETVGVLTDLIQSGLVYAAGRGEAIVYGITTDADRQRLTRQSDEAALADMTLGAIYRTPGVSSPALAAQLRVSVTELGGAIGRLEGEGRIVRDAAGGLRASTFQIPANAEHGWESAVFDHFQAVATGIASKVALRAERHPAADLVGGTTLRFELSKNHPMKTEVLGLLKRVRDETQAVWRRVAEHNDAHGAPGEDPLNVCFYFGQNLDEPSLAVDSGPAENANSADGV
jgi:hypothetical protein